MDTTLKDLARNLRVSMTDAEHVVWRLLRGRRLRNFKFRRQQPITGYIVDFVCIERGLVIEIDGGQHAAEDARRYDAARTACLNEKGFRVLRFWNNEVLNEPEAVEEAIYWALEGNPPSPCPLPPQTWGEGKKPKPPLHPRPRRGRG